MFETENLSLPLLQPSQAQKHVTVNEALVRLDGLSQLVVQSQTVVDPPVSAADGLVWAVPAGAVNAWGGQDGLLALSDNGGWVFITPRVGWRAWVADESIAAIWDGTTWSAGGVSLSPSGAGASFGVAEVDHFVTSGSTSPTVDLIPAQSVVFGVTARVLEAITGGLTAWEFGVQGAASRYGSGYGLPAGSWARGLTGSPLTYYEDTPLLMRGVGGNFSGGKVRFSVHYLTLSLPNT